VVVGAAHRAFDLRGLERAARAEERVHLRARDRRRAAGFVVEDVALALEQHFLPVLHLGAHRELVAHRSGHDEERSFLAQERGDPVLQRVDRGVVVEDVVADLGAGHGLAHRRGWDGSRCRSEGRSVRTWGLRMGRAGRRPARTVRK
jgi:hypothetical protein